MTTRFLHVPVVAPLHDSGAVAHIVEEYSRALREIGGEPATAGDAPADVPTVLLVVTGGTERLVLEAVEGRRRAGDDGPTLLVAHPGHNSLPASLEVLARLRQDGRRGRVVYLGGPGDDDGRRRLAESVQGLAARFRLRRTRIGAVGAPSDWLVASSPDPEAVRRTWGVEVVPLPMDAFLAALDAVSDGEAGAATADLLSRAGEGAAGEPGLRDAARVLAALRHLVAAEGLQAVTVRCFDLIGPHRTTGCLALAQLNDEGLVAGCEGDLASVVGMAWLRALLGRPAWMANPARADERGDTLWLAHCTVPWSMVGPCRLRSHFESSLGLAIQGRMPAGPVTLVRLGGRDLDRLWTSDAEIVATGAAEDLCRTQAQVRLPEGSVSSLLRDPLGNHLVLVPGHHAARLRDWMALVA